MCQATPPPNTWAAYDTPKVLAACVRAKNLPMRTATPEKRAELEGEFYCEEGVAKGKQAFILIGPPVPGKSTVADPLVAETKSLLVEGRRRAFAKSVDNLCRSSWQNPTVVPLLVA